MQWNISLTCEMQLRSIKISTLAIGHVSKHKMSVVYLAWTIIIVDSMYLRPRIPTGISRFPHLFARICASGVHLKEFIEKFWKRIFIEDRQQNWLLNRFADESIQRWIHHWFHESPIWINQSADQVRYGWCDIFIFKFHSKMRSIGFEERVTDGHVIAAIALNNINF